MFIVNRESSNDGPLELNIFINIGRIHEALGLSICKVRSRRSGKYKRLAASAISQEKQQDNDDLVEIHRRYQAIARIRCLSGQQQTDAIASEERKKKAYDRARLNPTKSSSPFQRRLHPRD